MEQSIGAYGVVYSVTNAYKPSVGSIALPLLAKGYGDFVLSGLVNLIRLF